MMPAVLKRVSYLREILSHPLNRNHAIRTAIRYLCWNVGRRFIDLEYVIPLVGDTHIIVSNEENYATRLFTEGLWEFSDMIFLLHFLRAGDLFVDVGAGVGVYTVLASAVGKTASIAFEPVPSTYQRLCRNIRLNGIESFAKAHDIGIADAPGRRRMTVGRGGLNHVMTQRDAGSFAVADFDTLDRLLCDRSVTMLKIDVEGFEMSVLRGAQRTLADPSLRALIIELNGSGARYGFRDEAIHEKLTRHGFVPYTYAPKTRTLSALSTFNRNGLNTLYCRCDNDMRIRLTGAERFRVRGNWI